MTAAGGQQVGARWTRVRWLWLQHSPLLLFLAVILLFGTLAPGFLTWANARNIAVQAAPTGIVAVGMTFVLLTAGVDLSVGALMFVAAAVAGKMVQAGYSLPVILPAMAGVCLAGGALNAFFITRLRVVAFIVTLAVLFMGRGLALGITQTRAINLPDTFLALGAVRLGGMPLPLLLLLAVVALGHLVLTRTPLGRQIYAVGNHAENARKAGLRPDRILAVVYLISGGCAAIGAVLLMAQLGSVSPKFGEGYEFKAIAAAVLGGTSLFGGRGAVFPGTLLGALLIQTLESGLVMANADPYLYPPVTAAVILLAVWIDRTRQTILARLGQRRIRAD